MTVFREEKGVRVMELIWRGELRSAVCRKDWGKYYSHQPLHLRFWWILSNRTIY